MTVTYPPGFDSFQRSLWGLRRIKSDPLAFLEGLARCPEDVVAFSLAGRPAFLLRHPDLVESVLVTHHHKFVKAYGLQRAARLLGNGLLTAEGQQHRRRRGAVQPAFHHQQLERYAAIMVGHAARVRDGWRQKPTIDISSEASALTLAIVGQALFGVDVDSFSAEVRQAVKTASDCWDPLISLLAPSRRVRPARQRLLAVIDQLIGAGENSIPRDDALTLLLAGHDTIANALVWTWILLAGHRDAEARMEAEIDRVLGGRLPTAADIPALAFTRGVLAESLRLRPPAWVIARSAIADHELGDVHIPPGSIVLISQYVIHRDARFFPNPMAFDPDRWLDERQADRPKMAYIPFGAGPRACIGEGFAWMEGVLLLATFAQKWRLRLAVIDDAPPSLRPNARVTLRPPPVTMVIEARRDRL